MHTKVTPFIVLCNRTQLVTNREYRGIAASRDPQQLLVSCRMDQHGSAGVDWVDRKDGKLVKTLLGNDTVIPDLFCPYYMHRMGQDDIVVSSFATHCIFQVRNHSMFDIRVCVRARACGYVFFFLRRVSVQLH